MISKKEIHSDNHKELSRFCASLGNPSRIAILETLTNRVNCNTDIIEIQGLSKFTVQQNLKYLKKFGLINGGVNARKISYCIDYEKVEEFKTMFDDFYNKIMAHKAQVNPENVPCLTTEK